ncbi:MAG: response regulator [Desulfobacteraceae bacterium]|nr:response regulator [Desulfobacteraceae bacterium]
MKKILIVDDRMEPRELVEVALRSGSYQLLQAENGAKAIEIAREEKPDLIIMDVMMPGIIDGLEATRALKNGLNVPMQRLIAGRIFSISVPLNSGNVSCLTGTPSDSWQRIS